MRITARLYIPFKHESPFLIEKEPFKTCCFHVQVGSSFDISGSEPGYQITEISIKHKHNNVNDWWTVSRDAQHV